MPPEVATPLVAVTGATGFIGRHLVPALVKAGWRVRILCRRDPASIDWDGLQIEAVPGDLADAAARARLVDGADAVIHLAGLIKASSTAAFMAVNRDGTRMLAKTLIERAPAATLYQISSMAAREPELSAYAASKRAGEDEARGLLGARARILRPAAVYGPGDRETLVFFQLAQLPRVPLLGSEQARLSVIHVEDLCSGIVAALRQGPTAAVQTVCDQRPQGYGWRELMAAAASAVGRPQARFFRAPVAALRIVAGAGDLGRALGNHNMLSSEKLRELLHEDWSAPEPERFGSVDWRPKWELSDGFEQAAAWYRAHSWLKT